MVVLPLPLSPMSETTSPSFTSKLTSRTATQLLPAEGADLVGLGDSVEAKHLIRWPSSRRPSGRRAISTKGGSSAHLSNASGQRARKRQPVGGLSRAGGLPGIPASFLFA